jgi:hypothetical protein
MTLLKALVYIKNNKYSEIEKLSKAITKNNSIVTLTINYINDTMDIGHSNIIFDNFLIPKHLLFLMLNVIIFLY